MGVSKYRHRYIVFTVDAPRKVERWELIKELQRRSSQMGMDREAEARPWLTAFQDNRGILRCTHTDKEKAIEMLKGIKAVGDGEARVGVTVNTVTTSGTIRKAKESL